MSESVDDEAEVLEGLPVLGEEPSGVEQPTSKRGLSVSVASPAHAAAVAVGGFLAGAAVVGLVRRREAKRGLARRGRGASARRLGRTERGGKVGELVQIVASRSLLVDVHLLGSPGSHR